VIRRLAALLSLAAAATALGGCGSGHASAASLQAGQYSGTLPGGAPVTLQVGAGAVQVNGRDAYLVDPTTTADFLVAQDRTHFYEWACTEAEKGRSLHCDTWNAPRGTVTPTALPCVSPAANTPGWCAGAPHVAVDLLRICSDAGC
jgi:hypothetical protein